MLEKWQRQPHENVQIMTTPEFKITVDLQNGMQRMHWGAQADSPDQLNFVLMDVQLNLMMRGFRVVN